MPGSMGVLNGLQSERLKHSRRDMMYWALDSDKVRSALLRVISTPSNQDVGPRSLNLKRFFRSSFTDWTSAADLAAIVISSMKTGMMILLSPRLKIHMLCEHTTLLNPIDSNSSFSFLCQHRPACLRP